MPRRNKLQWPVSGGIGTQRDSVCLLYIFVTAMGFTGFFLKPGSKSFGAVYLLLILFFSQKGCIS